MAKRPDGVDPEAWREQRAAHWRRINWVLNVLMVLAALAIILRYVTR
jgi:hypothetical protein